MFEARFCSKLKVSSVFWFRICLGTKLRCKWNHQGPHAKVLLFRAETDSGKSSSSSFGRPAAGRLRTCCEMPKCHLWVLIIWVNLPKAFAKVQLRVQTLSWRKSAFKKENMAPIKLLLIFTGLPPTLWSPHHLRIPGPKSC